MKKLIFSLLCALTLNAFKIMAQPLPTPTHSSPNQPTNYTFSQVNCAGSQTTVSFSCNSVIGATNYELKLTNDNNTSTLHQTGSTRQWSIALSNGVKYKWSVRAYNSTRTSAFSLPFDIALATCPPNLSSPSDNATNINPNSTALYWAASPGIGIVYDLYYSPDPTFSIASATKISNISGTAISLSNVLPGRKYNWCVQAIKVAANGTRLVSNYSVLRRFTTSLGKPTAYNVSSPGGTYASLSWSSVSGATSYYVQYSTSSTFSTNVVNLPTNSTNPYAYISGLTKNTTYYWRVAAQTSAVGGLYSNTVSFKTAALRPSVDPNEVMLTDDHQQSFLNKEIQVDVNCFPNPIIAGELLTVSGVPKSSVVSIYSLNGVLILSQNNNDSNQVQFNFPQGLIGSTYVVRVETSNGKTFFKKLLVR